MTFQLHSRLDADTFRIGNLGLSDARLMNDARYPWVILVPHRAAVREIIELERDEQIALLDEIAATSKALNALFTPDKLNVAALGNMVPQLHIHVIARRTSDAAWPAPVWGVGGAVGYADAEAAQTIANLRTHLGISA